MARIHVAILGAGRIAQHMADTLVKMAADSRYADLVEPYAVAARDAGRAADFAAKYGFPVSYGSYEELVADPNVDLVYIATPHNLHAEQAILCMKAGKGVLVEKAFGANAAQTREMLAVAKETGMLCAEAIWTRYMPSRAILVHLINGFGFHICVVTVFAVPCYIFHAYFIIGVAEVEAILFFKAAVVLVPFQDFLG